MVDSLGSYSFLSSHDPTNLFYPTPIKPLHVCAPFWLEIAECTLAPVAMEDSDHEVHYSSDEQDSCPASPNHSRGHDDEQVQVTPAPPKNSWTLQQT